MQSSKSPSDLTGERGTGRIRGANALPRQWFQSLYFLFPLILPYADAVFRTCRLRVDGAKPLRDLVRAGRPVIFCQWHGRLTAVVGGSDRYQGVADFWPSDARLTALVSVDADGIAKAFGIPTIAIWPGSVSSGDVRKTIAAVRAGSSLNVSLDGPTGPYRRAALGIVRLAQITGAPLVPVGFSVSPRLFLNSWDRFLVPLPFGRMVFHCGEPLSVPSKIDEVGLERARAEIERRLTEATDCADAAAARA